MPCLNKGIQLINLKITIKTRYKETAVGIKTKKSLFCFTKHTFPHSAKTKFSLVNKDPADGKADLRLEKRDIPLLFDVF